MQSKKDQEPSSSDRTEPERITEASDQLFRELANSAPAMLWATGPDGQCTFVSRSWNEFTGQAEGEALGFGWLDAVHPEDREVTGRLFRESNARQEQFRCEYRLRRAAGSYCWGINIGRPRFSPNGEHLGFLGSVIDIHDRKEGEEERRRLDERRRLALDAARLGSWNIDPDKGLMESDERFLVIFNGTGDPLTYQEAFALVHEEDRDRVRAAVAAAIRPEDPLPYAADYRVVHPDGKVRWVSAMGRANFAIEDGERRLKSFDGTVADITDRRQFEEDLRSKTERLNLLVENTRDYAVIISDPEGTVVEWQGGAERITGYTPAETIGQKAHLIFTPEDRAEGRPVWEMQKAAETGRAEDKRWHLRKDGSRFFADGVMTALYDEMGKLRGFGKVFKDATREREAEQATHRRTVQLQKLADIANRINSAHDVNSVLGVVTAEARTLVGAHQAATSMVLDPYHPQPMNAVSNSEKYPVEFPSLDIDGLSFYEAVIKANEPVRLTQEELDADPRWHQLKRFTAVMPTQNGWLAVPLVGRNGKTMGLIQLADKVEGEFTEDDEAILVQLSQLTAVAIQNARLYQELRTNDERKDEFLAMLAHELRNPLAAISNAVHLSSKTLEREHVAWSMEVITRQMKHLSRLIDDLMDVSRITRGKIDLRRDVMEVTPILESAAATVKTLVDERKHTLELAIDRGNLWASVDPTRLEQVVVNLLNNAAKYSENAGHILLSARVESGEIVISVKDRGVGIRPEKLPEMFELFAQGDRSLARSEGGLGIGLTVVKKLVEMHGGTITAKSEGLGKGSVFTAYLPTAKRPSRDQPTEGIRAEQVVKKARILVVDDNVDTAWGMARLLKLTGHEVATAHNGPEAIEVAKKFGPEFILLDIGLPGMSGYEVASQLRREECGKDTLIVAVSGYGQDEDRRRSKDAGFDYHLTKPLDHDALLLLLSPGENERS